MASPWRGPTDERNNYRACIADECRQGRLDCPTPAECATEIGSDWPRVPRRMDQVCCGAALLLSIAIVVAAILGVIA